MVRGRNPFGVFFNALRKKYSIRHKQLARAMGVTVNYIQSIQSGLNRPPTPERLKQICAVVPMTGNERKQLIRLAAAGRISPEASMLFRRRKGGNQPVELPMPAGQHLPPVSQRGRLTKFTVPVEMGLKEIEVTLQGTVSAIWIKRYK